MTQLALDDVLARLRARAEEDTEFADVLAALAQGDDGDADPVAQRSDARDRADDQPSPPATAR
jgi:hypothetical protein